MVQDTTAGIGSNRIQGEGVSDMDIDINNLNIKDIKKWIDVNNHPELTTIEREGLKFLLSEVERLEKENAALREVVEAAKKAWNKFSDNGKSLPCAGGHFVSGGMTINDMILIGEALEKIKDVETEDEHQ